MHVFEAAYRSVLADAKGVQNQGGTAMIGAGSRNERDSEN